MSPHPHANVIKAWADGSKIEWRYPGMKEWSPVISSTPEFYPAVEFRVAPSEEDIQYYRIAATKDSDIGLRLNIIRSTAYASVEASDFFEGWLTEQLRFNPNAKTLET